MGYDHATVNAVNAGNIYISCLFCYHAKAIREEMLWLRLVTPAVCHCLSTLRPPNLLVTASSLIYPNALDSWKGIQHGK